MTSKRKWKAALVAGCLALLTPTTALALPHTMFADADQWVTSPEDLTPAGPYAWAMSGDEMANATAWEIINGYPGRDITYCNAGSAADCKAMVTWKAPPEFRPGNTITHAEFAAILARAISLTGKPSLTPPFEDVESEGWYTPSVSSLYAKGIIKAADHPGGRFGPNTPISRAQLAAWTARAVEAYSSTVPKADLSGFSDAAEIPAHLRDDVAKAVSLGIIKGVGSGLLAPLGSANRVQSAAIMVRTLKRFNAQAPTVAELEGVIKGAMSEYVRQYELLRDRDQAIYADPGHYLFAKESEIKAAFRPYYSEQIIGPYYYVLVPGQSGYKNGRGTLTFPRWGWTLLNELDKWGRSPFELLRDFSVVSVEADRWPDGSPMLMDGFAKVRVRVFERNEMPQLKIGGTRTHVLNFHMKKEDGRWVITQSFRAGTER